MSSVRLLTYSFIKGWKTNVHVNTPLLMSHCGDPSMHSTRCFRTALSLNHRNGYPSQGKARAIASTVRRSSCCLGFRTWAAGSHRQSCSTKPGSTMQHENTSFKEGPSLKEFIASASENDEFIHGAELQSSHVPYIKQADVAGNGRKVYFETYGCQMNVSDTEVAWGILEKNGFVKSASLGESDVILVMTCAIREGAEQKIWKRLEYLKFLKKQRKGALKIGLLGCMAERLKKKIIEQEQMVDLVCGPDAYRDLPRMLAVTHSGQAAVNVLLSLDETYADVVPVRMNSSSPSAYVSIMRGCDNMCSYCIVPFTRGRERSRPISSILGEIHNLSEQGVKEVTLLGQNVNSYLDSSELTSYGGFDAKKATVMSQGFKTVYRSKVGGRRFADLLEQASLIDPEMRLRFTSPHPKDFPDELLYLIRDRSNICNQLHLPAQSGSTSILSSMRRGYSREAYLELVHHIRQILPDVSLSSDFIAGFCGETEEDHEASLTLIKEVKYNFAFCFPYSMRQKTHAYHRLEDDVAEAVKAQRHQQLIAVFREEALKLNVAHIGQEQLVLIEGVSKRSSEAMAGRNDGNTKVIIPRVELPDLENPSSLQPIHTGDYVLVKITDASSQVLKGIPLHHTTLQNHSNTVGGKQYHSASK